MRFITKSGQTYGSSQSEYAQCPGDGIVLRIRADLANVIEGCAMGSSLGELGFRTTIRSRAMQGRRASLECFAPAQIRGVANRNGRAQPFQERQEHYLQYQINSASPKVIAKNWRRVARAESKAHHQSVPRHLTSHCGFDGPACIASDGHELLLPLRAHAKNLRQ